MRLDNQIKPMNVMEIVMVIVFSISILITLDFQISIIFTISSFLITLFIYKYFTEDSFSKKIDFITKILIVSFFLIYIGDVITTYLGVYVYQNASETNDILVFMWDNFGVFLGWFYFILIQLTFVIMMASFLLLKDKRSNFIVFIFFLINCIMWSITLFNNIKIISS